MDIPSNESIENSKDALLGVGFTSKFKNISYFAQGKSVGESTMPYGSALLINFGDPLIQRVSESVKVANTNYDAGAGQSVFTNPDKTIFKSISTDLNHDGLQDIVIAYTDGSIQLLQNYGGKQAAYTNLGEVMRIAVPISDVQVGDTQGDNYPDLIITTSTHQLLVYPNTKGVFTVDGRPVCLNTNTEGNEVNPLAYDISKVNQIIVQDMNNDKKIDIVTNDQSGYIKIFYGGSNRAGESSYVSNST
jgi:hypothetical protein